MCLSTRPIKSSGTALNELWPRVLINVSRWHKMSLLKSTGFSFLISNMGLGAHDGGALLWITQAKMYSLWGPHKGRNTVQVTSTRCQLQAHSHQRQIPAYCKCNTMTYRVTSVLQCSRLISISPHSPRMGLIFLTIQNVHIKVIKGR